MENKQFDDLNDDFVESIKAKLNRREKADNSQFYTEDEVKDYWIYPLYSLTGNNIKNGIKASTNKITICATQIELGQKIRGYLTQNNVFSLNELADPTNPSESILKNTVSLVFSTQNDEPQFDTDYLYLLTKEAITTENFENIEKFVNQEMEIPNIENNNDSTSFIFREIKDLTSSYKISPIKIILSKPFTNKITELSFTSPNGCYVGNLKLKNKQGKVPNLIAKEGTVIFPKLVFPWQLEPNISMTDFWNGNQIIPLKDIFTFLDSKGIKYNQEFSLQDFLQLGGSQPPSSIQIAKAKRIKFNAVYDGNDQVPAFDSGSGTAYYQKNPFTSRNKVFELNLDQVTIFPNSDFSNSDSTAKNLYQSIASYGLVPYQESTKLNSIINLEIIPDGATPSSEAFEKIKEMLTYSYWKDREFKFATKIIKKDDQLIEVINNDKIYEIRTKFEGQDRYSVITNLWVAWKKENPTVVLQNAKMVNRIENALSMLSSNLKSNYCINKGDNDDYKVLLPYYFEVTNPLESPKQDEYQEYKDIVVKLKSNYGIFTEKGFEFNQDIISKNYIYQLDYNNFSFPEINNSLETSSIPSTMPLDQQLANGSYSKYLAHRITNLDEEVKQLYSSYGSGKIEFDSYNDSLTNKGEFKLQSPSYITELLVSSISGYGLWEFKLTDEYNETVKFAIGLFDSTDQSRSLISLIL